MNQLDIFLGGVVRLFTLGGLFGGAVYRVVQVAALVIAFRESWRITPWIESLIEGFVGHPLGGWGFLIPLVSFTIVYFVIRSLGKWFSSLTKGTFLWVIDKLLGLLLGLLVGVYLMGYGCVLFEGIFPTPPYKSSNSAPPSVRQRSMLYPKLIHAVEDIRVAKTLLFGGEKEEPQETTPAPSPKKKER